MTWYELWLFIHISAVAIWIGGGVVAQVFGALAKASGDPARSAAYGKDMGSVGPWVFMPASLVVLVSFTFFGYITRAMNRVGMRMAAERAEPGARRPR